MGKETFTKSDFEHIKDLAKTTEKMLSDVFRFSSSDEVKAGLIRQAIGSAIRAPQGEFRSILLSPMVIDGDKQNVVLVDFDPQGAWRLVVTEDISLKYLKPDGRTDTSREITNATWIEVGEKFPERHRFEIWLSEVQGGRVRELVGERVAA